MASDEVGRQGTSSEVEEVRKINVKKNLQGASENKKRTPCY